MKGMESMSEQQNELTFLMVKVSGSAETIKQTVAAVAQLIQNRFEPMPATPSAPALPRATDAPAEQPAPDHGQSARQLAGGASDPAAHTAPTKQKRSRSPLRARSLPAAPVQASFAKGSPAIGSKARQRGLRKDAVVFECRELPEKTFTMTAVAEMTSWSQGGIRARMKKVKAGEYFEVDVYHFRRVVADAAAPPAPESKPRARGEHSPINPHLVGRAAAHTPQELSVSAA